MRNLREIQDDSVETVKAELRAEALAQARAQYDPERAEKLRAVMRAALERVAMPRVADETTAIRRWAMDRSSRFSPVAPAEGEQIEPAMRGETMSISLGGALPTPEQVTQLAALVQDSDRVNGVLASVSHFVLPLEHDTPDSIALSELFRAGLRPLDLETLVNTALLFEFAAAHVIGSQSMARLLAMASLLWWTAGRQDAAIRALKLPLHYEPGWDLTQTMRKVLKLRRRAAWMDA